MHPFNNSSELNSFYDYITQMGQTPQTAKSYRYTIEHFLSSNPDAKAYNYQDVIAYLSTLNQTSQQNKQRVLAALKKYYYYLISIGERETHPCNTLYLRTAKRSKTIIFQDLFTPEELELLLEREERYQYLTDRNRLIMSLFIYQGLTSEEISTMKLDHIDLENAKLYIPSSKKQARRYLPIKPKQFGLFDKYLRHSRKQIFQVNNIQKSSDYLFINKLGNPIIDVKHLTEVFKYLFQDRNLTPTTIRKSVIANWLNVQNIPLEQVQLMAGHRWISSTIKYRKPNPERQRELINQWHPLG